MTRRARGSGVAVSVCCAIVGSAAGGGMRFVDVTASSGVDMTMVCGRHPSTNILEVDGGGVALFDFDNDGDLDLFLANGATTEDPEHGPGSRLYANNGDGTFRDVTRAVGINVRRWAMGVAVGDYDGDGCDDLYITCFGPNILLRNECAGATPRFVDVTSDAGVGDARWGTSAAFGDIDNDGDLDLYVANYLLFDVKNPPPRAGKTYKGVNVMAGPHGLTAQDDVLYENLGDGRFKDVSVSSGCRSVSPAYGLVAVMVDFDGDGRQDVFVGNDSTENFLFHNTGGGRFEEVGVVSGIASDMDGGNQATMGIALGDLDGNGRADAFTTSFSSDTNTVHLNLDGTFFDDRTSQFGLGLVSRRFLSWGCGLYDFDDDGDEDLFISNGHVYPEAATHDIDTDYAQPPFLFERDGGRFRRVTDAGAMFLTPTRGRAVAFGDIDGDGDVDIVMTALHDKVRVLRNASPRADVVVVELRRRGPNRHAYGAVVELTAGGRVQRRWIHGGGSFQSVDAPTAYFGVGSGGASGVTVRVRWPGGEITTIENVNVNHRITVSPTGHRMSKLTGRG